MIHQQVAAAAVQHMTGWDVGGLAVLLGFVAFVIWITSRD